MFTFLCLSNLPNVSLSLSLSRNKVATALAFVAVSIAYEVNQWDENFYQKLNVPRSASNADIRKVSSDSAQLKYID